MIPLDYVLGPLWAPVARALAWLAVLGAGTAIALVALVAIELRRTARRRAIVRSLPRALRRAA
jgi:pilus assembly protein TadC